MVNLHTIISQQFPEFIQADYPAFIEFIRTYYKWLASENDGRIEDIVDIDNAPAKFVEFFKNQLDAYGLFNNASKLGPDSSFNIRYLKTIKQLYENKGSEQALVYLLRAAYNAETTISYPNEIILRSSDGKWSQEKFITIQPVAGFQSIPTNIDFFYVVDETSNTNIRVACTRSQVVGYGNNQLRLYFNSRSTLSVTLGQIVKIFDANGDVIYGGEVIKSPASVYVRNGGQGWQLGQLITIPGTVEGHDTVLYVSGVDSIGAITKVDVLEFGFNHTESQTVIVSPYPNKPSGTTFDYAFEMLSVEPPVIHHILSLYDYTDGSTDAVQGIYSASGASYGKSYFLEDYVEIGYNGELVFASSTSLPPAIQSADTGITMEDWLNSRATFVLQFGTISRLKGSWADASSQLSDQSIRLEDNFYYQQFSYVINSDINHNIYQDVAHLVHPSGMKMFTNYELSQVLAIDITADTTLPFITQDLFDTVEVEELASKHVTRDVSDAVTSDAYIASVDKYLSDSVAASSPDTSLVIDDNYNDELTGAGYTAIQNILTLGV